VSDKPTVEQLEELSAKAREGEWSVCAMTYNDQWYPGVTIHSTGTDGTPIRIGDTSLLSNDAKENTAFIVNLVNFWRQGGAELVRDGLKFREPLKKWVQCERHKGMAMWISFSGHAGLPAQEVCPNCEDEAARSRSPQQKGGGS
jgi:hypothetical protein